MRTNWLTYRPEKRLGQKPRCTRFFNWIICRNDPVNSVDFLGLFIEKERVCTSAEDLKNEVRQIMTDMAREEGHEGDDLKPLVAKLDWLAIGRRLSARITRNRYVWTSKGGWIDLRHFLRAAFERNRFWVPGWAVRNRGVALEKGQAKGGDISAFGVEDLPSNEYGLKFEAKITASDMSRLPDQLAAFLAEDLGGIAAPPVGDIPRFNFIRNLSERPILSPDDADIITDWPTGIRYKSSGDKLFDAIWLDTMSEHGISGTSMGIGRGRGVPGSETTEALSGGS